MDFKEIEVWSNAQDAAEQFPLTQGLPTNALEGSRFTQRDLAGDRLWLRVQIVSGTSGARWAYWQPWADDKGHRGIGPHPEWKAIADRIFNGDAPHFIGMLGVPYTAIPGQWPRVWVLVEPKLTPPRPVNVLEEKPNPRYEKSKEVFDVFTQESRKL